MLSWLEPMTPERRAPGVVAAAGAGAVAAAVAALLSAGGCLKSLDESLLDRDEADGGGTGGQGGIAGAPGGQAGLGGAAGQAGTDASTGGGGASGGTGGAAGAPEDAPSDAPPEAQFFPYDKAQHPVTQLANAGDFPLLITTDASNVYRTAFGKSSSPLVKHPVAGGAGTPIHAGLQKPQALATSSATLFVYVAGRDQAVDQGYLKRLAKDGSAEEDIVMPDPIETAARALVAADNFVYFTAKAQAPNKPMLLRVSAAAGELNADVIFRNVAGGETAGDLTVQNGCVYFVGDGNVWVVAAAAIGTTERAQALSTPIDDALGLASDAQRFYFTRSNGEVWRRALSPASCDGSGAPEQRVATGFTSIGDVLAYDAGGGIAWSARGDASFAGGGIFTTAPDGIDVTQIAPEDDGPEAIAQTADSVVYATSNGLIKKVPK
jgi:hypothetical protein